MDGDHKAWILTILTVCLGIVAIVAITSWRNNEIMLSNERTAREVLMSEERLMKDAKITPAVLTCVKERNWNIVAIYEICRKVLANQNLTREEAEKLVEGLEK